jgi:hypothetical protein
MPDPIWEWTRRQVEESKEAASVATRGEWISIDGGVLSVKDQWPVVQPFNPQLGCDVLNLAHIARNDPRAVIADCEAKLRLLDEHYILVRGEKWPDEYDEFSVMTNHTANDRGCITCHYMSQGCVRAVGCCVTVRLLASCYQHLEGYQPKWGWQG